MLSSGWRRRPPIEYHKADPEIGGIDVYIFYDESRDDGTMIHCGDWGDVYRLLRKLKRVLEGAI
jgi:hypothetical protein